jgi:hypothetical protein
MASQPKDLIAFNKLKKKQKTALNRCRTGMIWMNHCYTDYWQ